MCTSSCSRCSRSLRPPLESRCWLGFLERVVSDWLGLRNRQFVCQGLTLAFAPRSSAKSKSEDGNFSFIVLIRPSGSLAFLSSSSKTTKYLSVKSTAVIASRGAPTLLCPGITTEGFNALIVVNESNHFALALLSVSAV